jgi:CRP-like cAMP-binding protein
MLQTVNFANKNMDYFILSQSPLFRGFTTEGIESLLLRVPHHVRKFKTGSLISQSGEPVNSLMIVLNGIVKGEMVDYAGRVIKIEDIPAPGALASAFMFGNKNRFPVNVIAITDTELLTVNKPEKIKFLNFRTIKAKLAYYILQKAGKDLSFVILDMTQNELAEFFGVARPSVARAIGEMEDEGLILAERRRIKIVSKKGLSDLILD